MNFKESFQRHVDMFGWLYKTRNVMANAADLDQTIREERFEQGLYCEFYLYFWKRLSIVGPLFHSLQS